MKYRTILFRVFVLKLTLYPFLTILSGQTDSRDALSTLTTDDSITELAPLVVSASRYEENMLTTPVSVTILDSTDLAREASLSIVAAFRNVPGVEFQQAGINRYLIALRGFNSAFGTGAYVMVDQRDVGHPAMGTVDFSRLPVDSLDLDRIEIVRGPGSAVYGPGVDKGVIHFITKDPFKYPGTSLSVSLGERSMRKFAFRHAGILQEKFAYKITGSYMEGEDWHMDPNDSHDSRILNSIKREFRDLDGNVARIVTGRDYDSYAMYLTGQLQYRLNEETRLIAHVDYGTQKNILNATLGEIQLDGPGMLNAQIQFHKGSFWIQAYGSREFVDGDNYFYRAGTLMYGSSYNVNVQSQYMLTWSEHEEPIVIGADYRRSTPESKGTIYGRFEEDDNFSISGGYVHGTKSISDNLFFRASCRLDYIDVAAETVVSTRAAFVYQPTEEQSIRLTYNHSNPRPNAGGFFYDLQVGRFPYQGPPRALMRFLGSATAYIFPDPPLTSSFLGEGRDPGIGISTRRAIEALTKTVTEDENLQIDDPQELQDYLLDNSSKIEGFSEGILTFRSGSQVQVVQNLEGTEQTHLPSSDTFEIGYKGIWQDRLRIELDLYYKKMKDKIFSKVMTPFVEVPADVLATELYQAINAAFTNDELAPFGINSETLANAYSIASATIANQPIGIIEPDENYNPDTLPEMVVTYFNAGKLDYFGTDISIEASFNKQWSAFANYSWISDNFFDDTDIDLPGTGREVSMNSPQHKFRTGFKYESAKGLILFGSMRYLSSFEVRGGSYYNGTVDSYTLVDAGLCYDFSDQLAGLQVSITAQNIFDKVHREYLGFPMLGRFVTTRLSYVF